MGDLLLSVHRNPEAMDRFETVLAIDQANPNARHGELAAATELALTARRSGHPEGCVQGTAARSHKIARRSRSVARTGHPGELSSTCILQRKRL